MNSVTAPPDYTIQQPLAAGRNPSRIFFLGPVANPPKYIIFGDISMEGAFRRDVIKAGTRQAPSSSLSNDIFPDLFS
jgi:hypothetical protein